MILDSNSRTAQQNFKYWMPVFIIDTLYSMSYDVCRSHSHSPPPFPLPFHSPVTMGSSKISPLLADASSKTMIILGYPVYS